MIGLNELYALVAENEKKLFELEAENRVLNKLINLEKSNCSEQLCEELPQNEYNGETSQTDGNL
jgi:hypothetical protein